MVVFFCIPRILIVLTALFHYLVNFKLILCVVWGRGSNYLLKCGYSLFPGVLIDKTVLPLNFGPLAPLLKINQIQMWSLCLDLESSTYRTPVTTVVHPVQMIEPMEF